MRQVQVPDSGASMTRRNALYVCKFSLAGALTATTSTREIHPIGGYLNAFVSHVATASTSGSIELDLSLNDEVVASLEILDEAAAAATVADTALEDRSANYEVTELDAPRLVNALIDYLEVTITSTGAGASDLTAFGVFS